MVYREREQADFRVIVIPDDPLYRKQRFTLDGDERLIPLLSSKGYEVFNSYTRHVLVEGCRKSGKSIAIANKVMRHAYETDGAIVAIICKTLKNAKGGVWKDLISFVMPGWCDAGIIKMVEEPKMEPDTKMHHFSIRNVYGTVSEIQLHSLEHPEQVEAKFKGTRFSFIWISEADQFDDRIVMDILGDQLRIITIPYEHHQMMLDCNPPEDGEDHWLHDAFFKERARDFTKWSHTKGHFHFELDDNPFLPPEERLELEEKYSYDQVKYSRFVKGMWVKDTTASHFDGYFLPNIHIVGNVSSPNKDEHEYIIPERTTSTLLAGYDIGEVNHAFGIWIPRVNQNDDIAYDSLDELVVLDKAVSIYDFATVCLQKIEYWTKFIKDNYNQTATWRHWGDSSMFGWRAATGSSDAAIFFQATNGKVVIRPATKGPGSIAARIGLIRRLLNEGRLYFSARTPEAIAWARFLRPGRTKGELIAPSSVKFKHKFDADTYIFASELPHEIERKARPTTFNGLSHVG